MIHQGGKIMKKRVFLSFLLFLLLTITLLLVACTPPVSIPNEPGNSTDAGNTGNTPASVSDKPGSSTDTDDNTDNSQNPTENVTASEGLQYEISIDGSGFVVAGIGTCSDSKIIIPATYRDKQVIGLADRLFEGRTYITEVTLPNCLAHIGASAFSGCTGLTNITIPSSVTDIGKSAFHECTSLTEVHITNLATWCNIGFSSADANPLFYAHDLYLNGNIVKDLVIPDCVKNIGFCAFINCTKLTTVTMLDGTVSIGLGSFFGCTNLVHTTISDSVTSIGNEAFSGCTSLTSITIPSNITNIGYSAFNDCYRLVEVYNFSKLMIRKGTDSNGGVGYYALAIYTFLPEKRKVFTDENDFCFYEDGEDCYLLGYTGNKTILTLPQNCHGKKYAINQHAFYNCVNLTSITIPDNVTEIGMGAFLNCPLESATIPAFACTFVSNSALKNVVITSGKKIVDFAFQNSTRLTSITIPDSITSIGESAFRNCKNLTEVYITDLVTWCNISFGSADANPLYYAQNLYLNENLVKDLVIPNGIENIWAFAFFGYTSLISITIPNSVIFIGYFAFSDCTELTSITFQGTKAEWNQISKDYEWNYNTGNYTVHCTDGDVAKQ